MSRHPHPTSVRGIRFVTWTPRVRPPAMLVDEFMESYVRWREACAHVTSAYERWRSSEADEHALAFAAYRAALDREDHAADVHAEWAHRVTASAR
jgi:hypothetical protein